MALDKVITFRGDWNDRDEWRAAWDKLIVRVRCLDALSVLLNDEKKVEMEAEIDATEIRLKYEVGETGPGRIRRIGIIVDRKTVFSARLRELTLNKRDRLMLVVLKAPNDLQTAAAPKGYRGDGIIVRKQ